MEDEDRKFAMYLEQEMRKEANSTVPPTPEQPAVVLPPANAVLPQPSSLPIAPPSYGEAISDTPPSSRQYVISY